jgi:hypothetical protein
MGFASSCMLVKQEMCQVIYFLSCFCYKELGVILDQGVSNPDGEKDFDFPLNYLLENNLLSVSQI